MATNEPLVPSMIFRSRTTKASSNVTEQKACSRSFSLLSSMSLIRTSVMTTVVLLCSVAHSIATPNDTDAGRVPAFPGGAHGPRHPQGLAGVAAQRVHGGPAAAHQLARRPQAGQPAVQGTDRRAQPLRH